MRSLSDSASILITSGFIRDFMLEDGFNFTDNENPSIVDTWWFQ